MLEKLFYFQSGTFGISAKFIVIQVVGLLTYNTKMCRFMDLQYLK